MMPVLRRLWSLTPVMAAGMAVLGLPATGAFAQDVGGVTGSVVSTIRGGAAEAVPGVTVRFPELRLEAATDDQGRFEFETVPAGRHEIRAEVFGCPLGSMTVEVRKGDVADVNFILDQPAIAIPGLVVTGPASEASGVDLPYSVGLVDPAKTERHPSRSIADLIRGEFPGVKIVQGSGLPGGEVSIQFRGPHSISSGHAPLVVVDGVITGGGMIDINPRDVRSIRVLKGSVAAAHYGSRGQAGVIEITTGHDVTSATARPGPLVIVDGALSSRNLADIDPAEIESMELADGTVAGVLFGPGAPEAGVVRIKTREGPSGNRGKRQSTGCFEPSP